APERLRRGDLDVVDVIAIPDRLENPVPEAEREEVLRGFLPEEVIDPVHVAFVERRRDVAIQCARRIEAPTERLLDDDVRPPPVGSVVPMTGEAGRAEPIEDRLDRGRRNREIEEMPAAG